MDIDIKYQSSEKIMQQCEVFSLSDDTRSLKENDIFIALPGEHFDGHQFIPDAIQKGAKGVIFQHRKLPEIRPYISRNPGVMFVGVKNTRRTLGEIARNYLKKFSLKKIVVTGSAGKTTTKNFIASVLSQKYNVLSSVQSFNNDIGVPKTVLGVTPRTEVLVQEFGTNHPGEIGWLSQIVGQDHAVITNIGPAHVGNFGSVEEIAREKKQALPEHNQGKAFLNADDSFFSYLKSSTEAQVKSFGLTRGDLFPEEILEVGLDESVFRVCGEQIRVRPGGLHAIINATASVLVGIDFGLSMKEIKKGVETCTPQTGRGRVYHYNGATIIDETYNANPLSVNAALELLGWLKVRGRKIFVFGDMLELGASSYYYHREICTGIMHNRINLLFTFGEQAEITAEACAAKGCVTVKHFSCVENVAAELKEILKQGDVVLIKGSRAVELDRVVKELIKAGAETDRG
ncbi:MAG: UDP-N-acetylmuramoyl-tripeptide--D-alanyl-D-alanine ligase [Spirochaetota bacterium]